MCIATLPTVADSLHAVYFLSSIPGRMSDSYWFGYFRSLRLSEMDSREAASVFASVGVTAEEVAFLNDTRLARLGMTDAALRSRVLAAIRAQSTQRAVQQLTEKSPLLAASPSQWQPLSSQPVVAGVCLPVGSDCSAALDATARHGWVFHGGSARQDAIENVGKRSMPRRRPTARLQSKLVFVDVERRL